MYYLSVNGTRGIPSTLQGGSIKEGRTRQEQTVLRIRTTRGKHRNTKYEKKRDWTRPEQAMLILTPPCLKTKMIACAASNVHQPSDFLACSLLGLQHAWLRQFSSLCWMFNRNPLAERLRKPKGAPAERAWQWVRRRAVILNPPGHNRRWCRQCRMWMRWRRERQYGRLHEHSDWWICGHRCCWPSQRGWWCRRSGRRRACVLGQVSRSQHRRCGTKLITVIAWVAIVLVRYAVFLDEA